jgi:hypothetical protein
VPLILLQPRLGGSITCRAGGLSLPSNSPSVSSPATGPRPAENRPCPRRWPRSRSSPTLERRRWPPGATREGPMRAVRHVLSAFPAGLHLSHTPRQYLQHISNRRTGPEEVGPRFESACVPNSFHQPPGCFLR